MKTARILCTIIGSGVFMLGVGFAGEPPRQPAEKDSRAIHTTSALPGNRDQIGREHSPLHDNSRASERGSQAAPINTKTTRTPANELHHTWLKKAAPYAKDGLMMNKIGSHHEQSAKLPGSGGITAPSVRVARAPGANVATLGGLAASSVKHSSAVVNGTGLRRKP